MDQYIGRMLDDRYEILERIGTGGMAVVYKAKCHRLNRLVAVKILKSDLAQDEDFRRRFHAESKAVAMLSHPNIVSVYDVSQSHEVEYIVMELIDGITLKQYMEKRGHLDWRESLHFITQIMRGLSHAHSRGIVHRDIKPQNIMVLRDGSVKVADFGIACLANSAQTLTQEALGSVHYISPEQARGDRPDARSDVYSAGVMLYEMLTNRLPFEGDSAVSVAIQHLSSIPLAPREINPEIPEPLELICMKAMAPDLERRYPSADAMIGDLEAFRKNPGVDLDISLEDLHPEEADEPTRLLQPASRVPAPGGGREAVRERAYDRDYERERRSAKPMSAGKRTAIIVSVVAVALVALFFLMRAVFSSMEAGHNYTVPNVTGVSVEAAKELDGVKGIFTISQAPAEYSDTVEKGIIISQDPTEGNTRKGNLEISVTVSLGERIDEVPEGLIGQNAVTVEKVLLKDLTDELNLKFAYKNESSDDVNDGCVIDTEPAAGMPLKKGAIITLIISSGPEKTPVTVPPFLTLPVETVKKQLDALDLKYTVEEAESEQPAGTVIKQSVTGDAYKGDVIVLTVSKGPAGGGEGLGSTEAYIPLPSDRSTVHLEVYQDGIKIFDKQEVDCSLGNYPHTFYGTGSAMLEIYWDGVPQPQYTMTITFDE